MNSSVRIRLTFAELMDAFSVKCLSLTIKRDLDYTIHNNIRS